MYFYLDGYNLLFSFLDSKASLLKQRDALISFLQEEFQRKQLQGTLVFDGAHRREEESGYSYRAPLEIAYAPKGQTADAYIVEKIELEKNPKEVTVITNDRGLTLHARALRAKVQNNNAFLEYLKKKTSKGKKRARVETPKNMERLLKAFEERLKKGETEEEDPFF